LTISPIIKYKVRLGRVCNIANFTN